MKLQILSSKNNFLKDSYNFRTSNNTAYGNGYPCYYKILKDNFSQIGIELFISDFENIDKSKPWIVDVVVQGWNFYVSTNNKDILDSFDDRIKQELLYGSAYLLLNHGAETHTHEFFKNLYRHLQNTKLKPNKIIYLSNAYEVDKHYKNFVKRNKVPDENKIFTMFSPHAFNYINEQDIKFYTYDRTVPKTKVYLLLNRAVRSHRLMMVCMLSYYDLLRHGYVSLGISPHCNFDYDFLEIKRDFRLYEGLQKIKDKLPLVIDTPDFITNHVGYTSLPIEFYQQTYFSLVSGTYALEEQEEAIGTNEKELKPMLAKQPFIICSKPKTLEYMRNMGFMTFSKWFDESYDEELNDIKRMEMIAFEVQRLSNLNKDQWNKILCEMEPVLLHNYNRLVNYISERCYFSSDLKKFLLFVA